MGMQKQLQKIIARNTLKDHLSNDVPFLFLVSKRVESLVI
jgi:hypothetical protein